METFGIIRAAKWGKGRVAIRPSILAVIAGVAMLFPVGPLAVMPLSPGTVEAAQQDARDRVMGRRGRAAEPAAPRGGTGALEARQRAAQARPSPAPAAPRAASPSPSPSMDARNRVMGRAPSAAPSAPRSFGPSPSALESRQRAMGQSPTLNRVAPRRIDPSPPQVEDRNRFLPGQSHSPSARQVPSRSNVQTITPLEARRRVMGQQPRAAEERRLPQPPSMQQRERLQRPHDLHSGSGRPTQTHVVPRRDRGEGAAWERRTGDRGRGDRTSGGWTDGREWHRGQRGTERGTGGWSDRGDRRGSAVPGDRRGTGFERPLHGRDSSASHWQPRHRDRGHHHRAAPPSRSRTRVSISIGAHFGRAFFSLPPTYVASPFVYYSTAYRYRPYYHSVGWPPAHYPYHHPHYYGHRPRHSFGISVSSGRHFRTNFSWLYHFQFGHVPVYPATYRTTLVRPAVIHVVQPAPIILTHSTVASSGWFGDSTVGTTVRDDRVGVVLPEPVATSEYQHVESEPLRVTTGADLGMTYLQLGDGESALRVLIHHLTDYPNDTEAIRAVALAYLLLGEGENGVRQIGRAYRLSPWLTVRRLPRGLLAPDDHAYMLDVATHTAAQQRSPDAWLTVAILMQTEERYGAARAAIERAGASGLDHQLVERFLTALPTDDRD